MTATSLECRFGLFTASATPPKWLSTQLTQVGNIFSAASNGDIQLNVSDVLTIPRVGSDGVNALELQQALESITNNAATAGTASNIGVIFTDTFSPRPDLFGLMFDPGPGFDGLPDTDSIPREGCAVFLKAIENRRAGTKSQEQGAFSDPVEAESFFTTVHELGHVFNLWHSQLPDNYMWSSAQQDFAPQSQAGFSKTHREFLAHCSTSSSVRPGGAPFGERDSLGPTDTDLENGPRQLKALKLKIQLSDQEFFSFQPIELEIDLRLVGKDAKKLAIPDVIDPGYDSFDIFVEEPDGQRRNLRSARRYCHDGKKLAITRKKPFQRDVSVFGDADGFFFRRSGAHKIWATLQFKSGRLVSNVLDLNVLGRTDAPRQFSSLAPVLSRPDVARFLYHRFAPIDSPSVRLVESAAHRFSRTSARLAKELHYTLGRFYAARALRSTNAPHRTELQRSARQHLDKAVAGQYLSAHRRHIAQGILTNKV